MSYPAPAISMLDELELELDRTVASHSRNICLTQVQCVSGSVPEPEPNGQDLGSASISARTPGDDVRTFDITPTGFRVGDFLQWQRTGILELNPPFQRRSVWKPDNRAYLLDTVVRGLPVPLIFIREVVDLDTQAVRREVVDGQQRLRSLFAYINPGLLTDYDVRRDLFVLKSVLNPDMANLAYNELSDEMKTRILEYKFAVVILPSEVEDRDILEIFARLNSTGFKLNEQELRNARFFGSFKILAYQLAYEQLERWRNWHVLSDDQISRMLEVQLTSDLLMNIIEGLTGRSQARLRAIYKRFDGELPNSEELARRFRRVMDEVENLIGRAMPSTVFSSEVHFFSLFTYLYEKLWGLGSSLEKAVRPKPLPTDLPSKLFELSRQFKDRDVPDQVRDAVERASTDIGRRRVRLRYMEEVCG